MGRFLAGFDSRRRPTTHSPGMQASRPHLSSREARQGAPSCRASMHQHKGCAQRRPPQDGTAGCQCTSTKAEHNDNHHSRGLPRTHPFLKTDTLHHHAGRQCTSTKAVHKDDHHKMGPQGVNAPARRLSTMTSPAVGARWGTAPPPRRGYAPRLLCLLCEVQLNTAAPCAP